MKNIYIILFLLLFSFSCSSNRVKHGYMFDLADHEFLQEGVTSKERVMKIMGSPSIVSDIEDEVWIYYSEDVSNFLFFKPTVKNREILAIRFNEKDLIENIKKLSLNDEDKKVDFTYKHTPVIGHKTGFFKSLFSNVGQVKPQ